MQSNRHGARRGTFVGRATEFRELALRVTKASEPPRLAGSRASTKSRPAANPPEACCTDRGLHVDIGKPYETFEGGRHPLRPKAIEAARHALRLQQDRLGHPDWRVANERQCASCLLGVIGRQKANENISIDRQHAASGPLRRWLPPSPGGSWPGRLIATFSAVRWRWSTEETATRVTTRPGLKGQTL